MKTFVVVALFCASAAMGEGVFVFKSHNLQDDKDAKVFVYKKLTTDNAITWVETADNKRFSFDLNQFKDWLEIPRVPPTIVSEVEIKFVKGMRNEVILFTKRYPASEKHLRLVLNSLNAIFERIEAGQVKFEGEWMDSAQHKKIIQERILAAVKMQKMQEALRMAEQEKLMAFKEAQRVAAEAQKAAAGAQKAAAENRLKEQENARKITQALERKKQLEGLDLQIAAAIDKVSSIRQQQIQYIQSLNETADFEIHD